MNEYLKKAITYHKNKRYEEAKTYYEEFLLDNPNDPNALHFYGLLCYECGNNQQAIKLMSKALKIAPTQFNFHANLVEVLLKIGAYPKAIESCNNALLLFPTEQLLHSKLGDLYFIRQQYTSAMLHYSLCVLYQPDWAKVYLQLGIIHHRLFKYKLAISFFNKTLSSDPDNFQANINRFYAMQQICDWSNYEENLSKLKSVLNRKQHTDLVVVEPFISLSFFDSDIQLAVAEAQADRLRKSIRPIQKILNFQHHFKEKQHLNIGYFSCGFRNHPISQLIEGVFREHDRNKFKIYAYSYGIDDGSEYRNRIKESVDCFVDIHDATIEEIAKRIYEDKIDILVDLNGYDSNSRIEILALRPAPVQVSYLYGGTTGASYVDYIFADKIVIPREAEKYYQEKVWYLPCSYYPNDDQQPVSYDYEITREMFGLPDNSFVYCCFNAHYKITPDLFAIWMNILRNVENSVLWILEICKEGKENLLKVVKDSNIDSRRIIFANKLEKSMHLARHKLADLFLDTFAYNAHTTAVDSLYVGVPLLTCPGNTFSNRLASSLLAALDMPELIVDTPKDYEEKAVYYGKNPEKYHLLRSKLLSQIKNRRLFNTVQLTRNIESAYQEMYKNAKSNIS